MKKNSNKVFYITFLTLSSLISWNVNKELLVIHKLPRLLKNKPAGVFCGPRTILGSQISPFQGKSGGRALQLRWQLLRTLSMRWSSVQHVPWQEGSKCQIPLQMMKCWAKPCYHWLAFHLCDNPVSQGSHFSVVLEQVRGSMDYCLDQTSLWSWMAKELMTMKEVGYPWLLLVWRSNWDLHFQMWPKEHWCH